MIEIVRLLAGLVNGISKMKTSRIVLIWCMALTLTTVWQAANIINAVAVLMK